MLGSQAYTTSPRSFKVLGFHLGGPCFTKKLTWPKYIPEFIRGERSLSVMYSAASLDVSKGLLLQTKSGVSKYLAAVRASGLLSSELGLSYSPGLYALPSI